MTYLRPHSRRFGRGARIAVGLLVGLIAIVGVTQWRAPHFFPGLATAIARPFWRTAFSIESGALDSPAALLAQNAELERELADLRSVMASSSTALLLQDNAELRSILGRASSTPTMTLAAVLVRPPATPYDVIIIDLGAQDGVASSTLVYAPGNIPIGKVSESLGQTSKVTLFSSSGQTYNVAIGASRASATAVGRGGGQYQAKMPHGSAVAVGDVVIDSALSSHPFGTVVSMITDPSSPFDIAIIAPPVNPYELRWVLLNIKKGK